MIYDIRLIRNFKELIEGSAEAYPQNPAFLYKEEGEVKTVTYREALDDIKSLVSFFVSKGLKDQKILLMGSNCYGWAVSYLAVCCGVGVIIPTDKELTCSDVENIIATTDAKAIIYTENCTEGRMAAEKTGIAQFDLSCLSEYIDEGNALRQSGDVSYENHKTDPDGTGIIIFTSGTSGKPKGVMLSQYNICSDIMSVLKRIKVEPSDRVLSVLPLHHTYECTAGFLAVLYCGASIAYAESIRRMVGDMKIFKPTLFVTVPLILQNIYSTLNKKIKNDNTMKAKMKAADVINRSLRRVGINASDRIYKTVHEAFGGRLRAFLCGAAPLSPELYEAFTSFGFDVYCGYGLTETSPVIIMHDDFCKGAHHTGYPICDVSVKIDEPDEFGVGQIAVKGPNVMLGYYNDETETSKVLKDGWFYTGDLGRRNEDGTYTVTGRIKSMIVLKNGKKIQPEELEAKLEASPLVCECMVADVLNPATGDSVVTAFIYPDGDGVKEALEKDKNTDKSYDERVKLLLKALVKSVNAEQAHFKHIHSVVVRKTEFVKTTTKKIKRTDEENLKR